MGEPRMVLAPMAGITDWPMRLICKRMGCCFAYTEMVSAKGMLYGERSWQYLETHPDEGKVGAQIFGKDPSIMADIARRIQDGYADSIAAIDINMGCPATKIVRNGEGSALLKDLPLAGRVMEAVAKACDLPVTVKYRKGFDEGDDVSAEMAHIAEQSGMTGICVHGRTRAQGYSGKADWGSIRAAKQACSIPVTGNGDVGSFEAAGAMLRQTGCDSVMVGRAAIGNPWVFNGDTPSDSQLYDTVMLHLDMEIERMGEQFALPHMRKQLSGYMAGRRNAAQLRQAINSAATRGSLAEILSAALCK